MQTAPQTQRRADLKLPSAWTMYQKVLRSIPTYYDALRNTTTYYKWSRRTITYYDALRKTTTHCESQHKNCYVRLRKTTYDDAVYLL